MEHLTKEQAKWLVEEYSPKRGGRINTASMGMFINAYNLLRNVNHTPKCSSCEARSLAGVANSLYEQFENEIKKLADGGEQPKRTTRKKTTSTKKKK